MLARPDLAPSNSSRSVGAQGGPRRERSVLVRPVGGLHTFEEDLLNERAARLGQKLLDYALAEPDKEYIPTGIWVVPPWR